MNDLTNEIMDEVGALLRRTPDEFGITLSGNMIEHDRILRLQEDLVDENQDKKNPDGSSAMDPMIGVKRIGF